MTELEQQMNQVLQSYNDNHQKYINHIKSNKFSNNNNENPYIRYQDYNKINQSTYQEKHNFKVKLPEIDLYNFNLNQYKDNYQMRLSSTYKTEIANEQKSQAQSQPFLEPPSQYHFYQPLNSMTTNKQQMLNWSNCQAKLIPQPQSFNDPLEGFKINKISSYQKDFVKKEPVFNPYEIPLKSQIGKGDFHSPINTDIPIVYQSQSRDDFKEYDLKKAFVRGDKNYFEYEEKANYNNMYLTTNKQDYTEKKNLFVIKKTNLLNNTRI